MSLIDRIKAGKNNTKTIKFPRTDQEVLMRIISRAQIQQARFDAEDTFTKNDVPANMMTSDEYEDERTCQMLYLVLRDPADPSHPIAKTYSEFKANITRDEQDFLANAYLQFEQECSPNPDLLTEEQLNELIDDLKKKPEQTAGSVSSISIARQLIISLVSRLATSQKHSGSTSS